MPDVVVIGAGHNGLVAACYLAKSGLDVEVVERDTVVGGAVSTVERFPGYRMDRGSSAHIMVRHTGIVECHVGGRERSRGEQLWRPAVPAHPNAGDVHLTSKTHESVRSKASRNRVTPLSVRNGNAQATARSPTFHAVGPPRRTATTRGPASSRSTRPAE